MDSGEFVVYLRGVDLIGLAERYRNGEFKELKPQRPIVAIKDEGESSSIMTVHGENYKNGHSIDLGTGGKFTCISYVVRDRNGDYGVAEKDRTYNCLYCLRPVTGDVWGLPIRKETKGNCEYFHTVDVFCSMPCRLAEYSKRYRNPIYADTMTYMGEIYFKSTGRDLADVKPARDNRLLVHNNGLMSWDEFHSEGVEGIVRPGNMYFLPVIEYTEA